MKSRSRAVGLVFILGGANLAFSQSETILGFVFQAPINGSTHVQTYKVGSAAHGGSRCYSSDPLLGFATEMSGFDPLNAMSLPPGSTHSAVTATSTKWVGYSNATGWDGISPIFWSSMSTWQRIFVDNLTIGQFYDVADRLGGGSIPPNIWAVGELHSLDLPAKQPLVFGDTFGSFLLSHPGTTEGIAEAVNSHGDIAGNVYPGLIQGVVTWTPNPVTGDYIGVQPVPVPGWPTGTRGTVVGITNDKFVGGYIDYGDGTGQPFITGPGATQLLLLGTPGQYGPPSQFTSQVVGGQKYYRLIGNGPHPYIWVSDGMINSTGNNGAFDLEAISDPDPVASGDLPTEVTGQFSESVLGHFNHDFVFASKPVVSDLRPTVLSMNIVLGSLQAGTFQSLQKPDGDTLKVVKGLVPNLIVDPIRIEINSVFTRPVTEADRVWFRVTSCSTNFGAFLQTVNLWNYSTNAWDTIDIGLKTLAPHYRVTSDLPCTGSVSRYTDIAGNMKAQVKMKQNGLAPVPSWGLILEQANWIIQVPS